MSQLSEKTLIPVGMAVISIGGGAAWLTVMNFQGTANAQALKELTVKQDRYQDDLTMIRQGIAEINGRLKEIDDHLRRR